MRISPIYAGRAVVSLKLATPFDKLFRPPRFNGFNADLTGQTRIYFC